MAESLAVKYRPRYFFDVIGQERSIQILQNQIKEDKVRQGYLFCGAAGCGKTTVARIMATSLKADLVEIDAASNNGVDNVRELRENVKFKPLGHEKRVYIIDECHMLSSGAFNALLKVLEEPPAHIIFILCTTDPQKLPATIISRLQRFDFRRVSTDKIVARLRYILNMEGEEEDPVANCATDVFSADDDALEYIAKCSGGGVRDSISLMDTCLGYSSNITLEQVLEVTGAVGLEKNFALWEAIAQNRPQEIVAVIGDLFEGGKDLKVFVRKFIDFITDLQVYAVTKNWDLVDIPKTYSAQLSDIPLRDCDFQKIVPAMFELNKLIQYDPKPKNLIIGQLLATAGVSK